MLGFLHHCACQECNEELHNQPSCWAGRLQSRANLPNVFWHQLPMSHIALVTEQLKRRCAPRRMNFLAVDRRTKGLKSIH